MFLCIHFVFWIEVATSDQIKTSVFWSPQNFMIPCNRSRDDYHEYFRGKKKKKKKKKWSTFKIFFNIITEGEGQSRDAEFERRDGRLKIIHWLQNQKLGLCEQFSEKIAISCPFIFKDIFYQ